MVKRIFDLVIASLLLVVLAPVIAAIALCVRVALGSPVIFRQERPGLNGRPFVLLKFRTMLNALDSNGLALPDGKRVTAFGRFLRRTSMDELPELFNVLCGDMSLVGPRPLLMEYLHLYDVEQARRHAVRPGITGWAQINGRNAISWEDKFRLDVWYVEHASLWLDLKILSLTLWEVLWGEGVTQRGSATAEAFKGAPR